MPFVSALARVLVSDMVLRVMDSTTLAGVNYEGSNNSKNVINQHKVVAPQW